MEPIADLASLLVTSGLITEGAAVHIRHEAAVSGRVQIRVACEAEIVSDVQVFQILRDHLGIEVLDPEDEAAVDLEALRWLSQDLAEAHLVLPLRLDSRQGERVMRLAMADPLCAHSVQVVERSSGFTVDPLLAEAGALSRAIQRCYGRVATKLIPRPASPPGSIPTAWPGSARTVEQQTQPAHRIEDEASPAQLVWALVNVLAARGLLDREDFVREVKRLLREDAEG